jgi:L-ribulose-5-phosphate 4-epimerase
MQEDALLALKQELARVSVKAYERGLVFGTGGNISVRIPGTNLALITPTGVSLGDTTVFNLSTIEIETGEAVPDCEYKPSKERYFHAAIFRLRPEINAVVHLHPPYATAWSVKCADLPLVTVTAQANLKRVPCVPAYSSGSADLRDAIAQAVEEVPDLKGLLMCRHGAVTMGTTLVQAYNLSDLLEDSARAAWLALALPDPA